MVVVGAASMQRQTRCDLSLMFQTVGTVGTTRNQAEHQNSEHTHDTVFDVASRLHHPQQQIFENLRAAMDFSDSFALDETVCRLKSALQRMRMAVQGGVWMTQAVT
jgi:hypothetical protein